MVEEDTELDQMYVKSDNVNMYCAKCMAEMKSIRKGVFLCSQCGQRYIQERKEKKNND